MAMHRPCPAPVSPTPFSASLLSSPAPSTPSHMWSSVPASTAPSSPAPESDSGEHMKAEEDKEESPFLMGMPLAAPTSHADEFKADEEVQENEEEAEEDEDEEDAAQYKQLERVLEKSVMYSALLSAQMAGAKVRHVELLRTHRVEAQAQANAKAKKGRPAKRRKGAHGHVVVEDEVEDKARGEMRVEEDAEGAFPQPALVTGARLKDYQLEGLQWMVSLHENGISGILADEMGLGKTLQTITFSAHLHALRFSCPFLIVFPLSVLHNWVDEYTKFAPGISVVIYHGRCIGSLAPGSFSLNPGYPDCWWNLQNTYS
ncbi:hypothetical protein B0H17DRAFT_1194048 [Mycena rosella]|uniref:SNF2 N-terminal domain-containing protein n=1 Tax=Mycena rosella TaxID=1033263 RepID=A0AAD7DZP6_MYCRO|nr:hypothetical protein B0H17DRAFT_1194048 [Mycena rosella]